MCAHHLPRERCAQTLTDLFGVTVSTGTVDNWMRDAAAALVGFLATVTAQLHAAPVVHADETSVRSEKSALWVHVTCTALLTLLHFGRRNKTTVEAGPLGDYPGTIGARPARPVLQLGQESPKVREDLRFQPPAHPCTPRPSAAPM